MLTWFACILIKLSLLYTLLLLLSLSISIFIIFFIELISYFLPLPQCVFVSLSHKRHTLSASHPRRSFHEGWRDVKWMSTLSAELHFDSVTWYKTNNRSICWGLWQGGKRPEPTAALCLIREIALSSTNKERIQLAWIVAENKINLTE